LALAMARRAREISDSQYYNNALRELDIAFKLAPDNLDARRTRIWVLLGMHEFAAALAEAETLHKGAPDDLMTLAMMVDGRIELGRYAQAEEAAQWLLDLRPGNIPGLTRAAYLRELFGDIDGAIQLMEQAYSRTQNKETEERAWLVTHLAHLYLAQNKPDLAAGFAEQALQIFPDYHYALSQLAFIRQAQGKPQEALTTRRNHVRVSPQPENMFQLGAALSRTGHKEEAQKVFSDFEKAALAESNIADNANRELVFYYADYANNSAAALKLAKAEAEKRKDVFTLDALAWAYYHNGQYATARKVIDSSLAVGTVDSSVLYHAGLIAEAEGDLSAARNWLEKAITLAPLHDLGPTARQVITKLDLSKQKHAGLN
jgi:tetratricopeptide (TPR) repeat protein